MDQLPHFDDLPGLAARFGVAVADVSPPVVRQIRGPDGALNLLDWGGDGPAVLLLHGGALTARTWDYVALGLRARFRLLALDLRGHGESDWADRYALSDHAADVAAVLDGLGLPRAHLAGMSLGGTIAAAAARAYGGRFESLTLVDVAPGVRFESTRRMRDFLGGMHEAASVEEVVDAALRTSPRSHRDKVAYRMATLLAQGADGRWRWKQDRRRPFDYASVLAEVAALDRTCAAAGLPVMLARGGRSRVLDAAAADRFIAAVPCARLATIADAGHNVQEDNPADLAEALAGFWSGAV